MGSASRAIVSLSLAALIACAGSRDVVPTPVQRALAGPTTDLRIVVEDGRIVAWLVAIDPARLPPRARRAAESVQPGGEIEFCAIECRHDGDPVWIVEKRYRAPDPEGTRSVTVAEDGRVLRRSHSLPASAAPEAVFAAIGAIAGSASHGTSGASGTALDTLEFVADDERTGPRYLARFRGASGERLDVELTPHGAPARRVVHHRAVVLAPR